MIVSKAELIDRGLWELACSLIGINHWESAESVNPMALTHQQAVCLGLEKWTEKSHWDGVAGDDSYLLDNLKRVNETWWQATYGPSPLEEMARAYYSSNLAEIRKKVIDMILWGRVLSHDERMALYSQS